MFLSRFDDLERAIAAQGNLLSAIQADVRIRMEDLTFNVEKRICSIEDAISEMNRCVTSICVSIANGATCKKCRTTKLENALQSEESAEAQDSPIIIAQDVENGHEADITPVPIMEDADQSTEVDSPGKSLDRHQKSENELNPIEVSVRSKRSKSHRQCITVDDSPPSSPKRTAFSTKENEEPFIEAGEPKRLRRVASLRVKLTCRVCSKAFNTADELRLHHSSAHSDLRRSDRVLASPPMQQLFA